MTPDRAKAILDSWCAMSPDLLDNVCLSDPARIALEELKRFRWRERLVKQLLEQIAFEAPEYVSRTTEVIAAAVRDFKVQP